MYSRNVKSNVRHKIFMKLMSDERSGMAKNETVPYETAKSLSDDADKITNMIENEYESKGRAGALWLDRMLKDENWLADIQEKSWKVK